MSSPLILKTISAADYLQKLPFPHHVEDNFLPVDFALALQQEILSIPHSEWDRYENPFERKFTLRDKYSFPPLSSELFKQLESQQFIDNLSNVVGAKLLSDKTRNFWGIHKYANGDYLHNHVDAGYHPKTGEKKFLTVGIYLSKNWKTGCGGELQICEGSNAGDADPVIGKPSAIIEPVFNRMIMFTCTDNSWHGAPTPTVQTDDQSRIFLTMSYMCDIQGDYKNKRVKAYFARQEGIIDTPELSALREERGNISTYSEIYRHNM